MNINNLKVAIMKNKFQFFNLKTSILFPTLILVVILNVSFIYSYIQQDKRHMERDVDKQFLSAKLAFDTAVTANIEKLSSMLDIIIKNPHMKKNMITGDRNALLKHSTVYFNTFKEKHNITLFYFHLPERINFLRVHKPEFNGDLINRTSILKAEATGKIASASEIGPLGYYTLRVVLPWYENEKLIGYVELGEEIEQIYLNIKNIFHFDLGVTIDKQFVSRKLWEESMKKLGRQADWDLMPDSVVTFLTIQDINTTVLKHFVENDNLYQNKPTEIFVGEHLYIMRSVPLPDETYSQHSSGRMFFILEDNIYKHAAENEEFIIHIAFGVTAMLMLFIFFLTRRVEIKLKNSTKELIQKKEQYRSLVENSSDWIWEVDVNGCYVYASPMVKNMLGYEVNEVLGRVPFDFMPKEERKHIAEAFVAISKERRPFAGLENANLHKDGHIVIIQTSGVPIFEKDGTFIGYRGIDRDITQKKHDEEKIQKLTKRLMLHFEQSPLGVIEWDMNFKVAEWNPAAEKIFGYTKAEAIGRSVADLILTTADISNVTVIWDALLSDSNGRNTNENRTKNGNVIICKWYSTPLVDEKGITIGIASSVEDITDRKRDEEKIIHMAYYDELTQLPNRTLFNDRFEQNCHKAKRNNYSVGLLFIDIDYFKNINDTLGHLVGDLLLIEVAKRFKDNIRNSDTVARFGGDEFAIIVTDLKDANAIKDMTNTIFEKFKEPFKIEEHELFITLSMGSSIYPDDDTKIEHLIRNADTAMYSAKEQGRNRHQKYYKAMTQKINISMSLQDGLRRALKNQEFILYYQPQMDIQSGIITGVEALVRWQHPEGMKFPDEFIASAEEMGLIVPLGEWIIRTACKQAKKLQELGLTTNVNIAINLSARQFREEGFVQNSIDIINESGVDPNLIEFELTESVLADNTLLVGEALFAFKQLGIQISLDDFGTGYSSLSYLKLLPIDKLKIDQSFVRDVLVNENDASLIRAIISMAKALNLKTIAEGVETKQQLDFLRTHKCEEIQGYFLAKPMPAEALESFLLNL
jgi:diguanylate cyclase (GGDEF)-like protein/PAS domain S-box-containing protein